MAGMTTYLENALLGHSLGQATYTAPTSIELGLFTADPTDDGLFTNECSGGSYARVDITSSFGAISGGLIENDVIVQFVVPTADWGTVTHMAIIDQLGNMIYVIPLVNVVNVYLGDDVKFKIGNLTVKLN